MGSRPARPRCIAQLMPQLLELRHHRPPLVRELDDHRPGVVGRRTAADEPGRLQHLDHEGDARRLTRRATGQLGLGARTVGVELLEIIDILYGDPAPHRVSLEWLRSQVKESMRKR